jgi:dihydrofolate reductase
MACVNDLASLALKSDIRMIAASSSNFIIGSHGQLPWSIPEVRLQSCYHFKSYMTHKILLFKRTHAGFTIKFKEEYSS